MDFLIYAISGIVFLVFGAFLTRWVFGIDKILAHLKLMSMEAKIQRRLLQELAKKQGLTEEELLALLDKSQKEVY